MIWRLLWFVWIGLMHCTYRKAKICHPHTGVRRVFPMGFRFCDLNVLVGDLTLQVSWIRIQRGVYDTHVNDTERPCHFRSCNCRSHLAVWHQLSVYSFLIHLMSVYKVMINALLWIRYRFDGSSLDISGITRRGHLYELGGFLGTQMTFTVFHPSEAVVLHTLTQPCVHSFQGCLA